jgi:hypothetical protein
MTTMPRNNKGLHNIKTWLRRSYVIDFMRKMQGVGVNKKEIINAAIAGAKEQMLDWDKKYTEEQTAELVVKILSGDIKTVYREEE